MSDYEVAQQAADFLIEAQLIKGVFERLARYPSAVLSEVSIAEICAFAGLLRETCESFDESYLSAF